MTDHEFVRACALTRNASVWEAQIPDGWQQGRGAFGGLVIGLMTKALAEEVPGRPLRALTAELPAPLLPGEARVEVRTLRAGSKVSTLQAILTQKDKPIATATGVFGLSRESQDQLQLSPPNMSGEPTIVPMGKLGPRFARHFEYGVLGALPFSGASESVTEGWVRFAEPPPEIGAPEVVALTDAYWPAAFTKAQAFTPMATISYTLQLTGTPVSPETRLFYTAKELFSVEGYSAELRQLWTEDGRLVALNPQTFVVI